MYFRVYYPFHPLSGRRLPLLRRFKGPPAVLATEVDDGTECLIPAWMAEPAAAELKLHDRPHVGAQQLLVLATVVGRWRSELDREDTCDGGGPGSWGKPSDDEVAYRDGPPDTRGALGTGLPRSTTAEETP